MLSRNSTITIGLALLGWLACTPEADVDADIEAIGVVRDAEWAAFSGGDAEGLVAVFASNGVVMPPDAPAVTGSAEIRSWGQTMADQFSIDGGYTSTEVEVLGDWAFENYTGRLELKAATGETVEMSVKGIHIYQRQPDGSWAIVRDVWNSDNPPPCAP